MYSGVVLMSQSMFSVQGGVVREPLYLYARQLIFLFSFKIGHLFFTPPRCRAGEFAYELLEVKRRRHDCFARGGDVINTGEDGRQYWVCTVWLRAEID